MFKYIGDIVSTAETSWDRQDVTLRQGDQLTIVCTVTYPQPNDVVRIFFDQNGVRSKATVSDNAFVKTSFAELTRLNVTFEVHKSGTSKQLVSTLSFNGRLKKYIIILLFYYLIYENIFVIVCV